MDELDLATARTVSSGAVAQSYEEFLEEIKGRIRSAQARAARAISAELLTVYWQIGKEIVRRQGEEGNRRGRGGPKVIERLSADLRAAFPGARGYSVSSLRYMRAFALAWPEAGMLQSGFGGLPWGHVTLLLDRLDDRPTRDWYAARASSWSRVELEAAISSRLHEREGAAITNFRRTLDGADAAAVQQIARDPVVLDFVRLRDGAKDRNEAVSQLTLQGIATPIAVTRYTVGERGVQMAGHGSQVTPGLRQEIEGLRRVERQVAEFTARRARELSGASQLVPAHPMGV